MILPEPGRVLPAMIACAGAGAFIDFYIGKDGQKRLRDRLETWWLRFSYVQMRYLGRDEALFVTAFIDRFLGRRMISIKRITIVFAIGTILTLWMVVIPSIYVFVKFRRHDLGGGPHWLWLIPLSLLGLTISISFTRFSTYLFSKSAGRLPWLNLIVLPVLLAVQYVFLYLFAPAMTNCYEAVNMLASDVINDREHWYTLLLDLINREGAYEGTKVFAGMFDTYQMLNDPMGVLRDLTTSLDARPMFEQIQIGDVLMTGSNYVSSSLSIIPNVGRILLLAIFLSSYCLAPFSRIFMNVLARVIESDKPIFTLAFGGLGAAVKLAEELQRAV